MSEHSIWLIFLPIIAMNYSSAEEDITENMTVEYIVNYTFLT